MLQTLQCGRSLFAVILQQWKHKRCNFVRLFNGEVVFFVQYILDRPKFQLLDMLEIALTVKIVLGVLSCACHLLRHLANKFLDHSEVIFVPIIIWTFSWIKKEIASK